MLRFIFLACLSLTFSITNAAEMKKLVDANTHFGLDIYTQLRTQQGNLFFSPYSISTALSMSVAGAKSTTAQQMLDILHFSGLDNVHAAYEELQWKLNRLQAAGHVKLHTVNAIWYEQTYTIQPHYQALIEKHYTDSENTVLNKADFQTQSEVVRQQINGWVEQQTQGKIKDLLSPNIIGADTIAALVNAIYFKSAWLHAFKPAQTEKQTFYLNAKQTKQVDMMQQVKAFQYMENDQLQLLELPYQRNDLSMLIFLPKTVQGLATLEKALNADNLALWMSQLRTQKVDVSLPKFRTESSFDLVKALQALGIHDAFNPQLADFTGLIDTQDEFAISAVVHKAFIDVDEKGTEAAAATAVIKTRSATIDRYPEPPIVFNADHPFLFLIKDNYTHSVLFLGRIVDPTL